MHQPLLVSANTVHPRWQGDTGSARVRFRQLRLIAITFRYHPSVWRQTLLVGTDCCSQGNAYYVLFSSRCVFVEGMLSLESGTACSSSHFFFRGFDVNGFVPFGSAFKDGYASRHKRAVLILVLRLGAGS